MGRANVQETGKSPFGSGGDRFRVLAEHARDPIIELSADGKVHYASAGFGDLAGLAAREVVGSNAFDWVHEDDVGAFRGQFRDLIENETAAQATVRFRRGAGAWGWTELSSRAFRTEEGEVRAVVAVRDVGDRHVEAEETLQEEMEKERSLAQLARRFLSLHSSEFEDNVVLGLEAAGNAAGADRVQFISVEPNKPELVWRYAWTREGVSPPGFVEPRHPIGDYQAFKRSLVKGEVVHVPRTRDLGDEARAERSDLLEMNVGAYLAIPVLRDGVPMGVLDFFRTEEGGWALRDIERLTFVSEVLGAAAWRARAERARRAIEERLRHLTGQLRDTVGELSMTGDVLFLSDNFSELSGWQRDDLQGIDPWTLVHPDDLTEMQGEMARIRETGNTARPLTYRIRHKDGTWRWLESSTRVFETPDGDQRLAIVVRDCTRRQEESLAIRRQLELEKRVSAFSRALLEHGADGVDAGIEQALEFACGIADADRAFLMSLVGDESHTFAIYDWHAPGIEPRETGLPFESPERSWIGEMLERGEVVVVPRAQDLPDDRARVRDHLVETGVKSMLLIPLQSEGRLVGSLGFHCLREEHGWSDSDLTVLRLMVDLFHFALRRKSAETDLRESQERLVHSQKMEAVGALAGGIAHDFNNQLTIMLANARFARSEVSGNEDLETVLDDLCRAADHCAQLTRSLLAFSRRTPIRPRLLDVTEMTGQAEDLLRPLIPSTIQFEVSSDAGMARVLADPTQLQQVLVNLVVNARDAMRDGGGTIRMRVRARRVDADEAERLGVAAPGPWVEFAVSDTGCGMDAETRSRIFEPFFTTKAMGEGTGLGLATAYGIVNACGGTIAVESVPDWGSTFRVFLPEAVEDDEEVAEEDAPVRAAGSGTVLLAEDESGVRRIVSRMLREGGFDVVEAEDGATALERGADLGERLVALVTDVDMPKMTGTELARRLAEHAPGMAVVYISGAVTGTTPGAPDGADGAPVERCCVLGKPFNERELLGAVHSVTDPAD